MIWKCPPTLSSATNSRFAESYKFGVRFWFLRLIYMLESHLSSTFMRYVYIFIWACHYKVILFAVWYLFT